MARGIKVGALAIARTLLRRRASDLPPHYPAAMRRVASSSPSPSLDDSSTYRFPLLAARRPGRPDSAASSLPFSHELYLLRIRPPPCRVFLPSEPPAWLLAGSRRRLQSLCCGCRFHSKSPSSPFAFRDVLASDDALLGDRAAPVVGALGVPRRPGRARRIAGKDQATSLLLQPRPWGQRTRRSTAYLHGVAGAFAACFHSPSGLEWRLSRSS